MNLAEPNDVDHAEPKAQAFAALHRGPTFVIPNPWDIASARALADFGFVALATSSGASGWALGGAKAS